MAASPAISASSRALTVDGGVIGVEVSTVVSIVRDELEVLRVGKGPVDALLV